MLCVVIFAVWMSFFPRMWMSVLMYICVGTSLLGSVRMVSSLVSVMLSSCGWGCVDELCFVVVWVGM